VTDTAGQISPGWYGDPSGRHQLRYFSGQWTDHVSDNGVVSTSPLVIPGPTTGSTGQSRRSRNKIIWTVVGIVGVVVVAGVALGAAGGSGSSGGTAGSGGSGGTGATASSFATPSVSLCHSIGTGWSEATTIGGPACALDLDDSGFHQLVVGVTKLQASSKDTFNGVSPSVSDLIKQDEQGRALLWTETFTVPGYALAGADTDLTGGADAFAYASNGTSLDCGALDLGPMSRASFTSQCAAAFKVLAHH
jgi:Protein of unknown function (DUF2510)